MIMVRTSQKHKKEIILNQHKSNQASLNIECMRCLVLDVIQ